MYMPGFPEKMSAYDKGTREGSDPVRTAQSH